MFAMPKSITNITKSLSARLELHTTASLAKSEMLHELQSADLKMWRETQLDAQNERINQHLKRKQLSAAEQAAIEAWRNPTPPATTEATK